MRCPYCDAPHEQQSVIDSRQVASDHAIRRRRKCEACAKRYTTYERINLIEEDPDEIYVVGTA